MLHYIADIRSYIVVAALALSACETVPYADTHAPCFLSERHAQDLTVQDHPVAKTPLPKHVDQNITDRQALADAVARYNELRGHVRDHCQ